MEVNGAPELLCSFVFGRTKTFIQVWNYLGVSKWWHNCHFWVNYLFNSLYTSPDPVLHLMSDFLMYFSHHGLQQISKALMTGFIYIWSHVSITASSSLYIIETQCTSAVTAERRRRLQDHRHPQSIPGHLSSHLSQRCKHTHWVFRIWMRVCKCCSSIQKTSA